MTAPCGSEIVPESVAVVACPKTSAVESRTQRRATIICRLDMGVTPFVAKCLTLSLTLCVREHNSYWRLNKGLPAIDPYSLTRAKACRLLSLREPTNTITGEDQQSLVYYLKSLTIETKDLKRMKILCLTQNLSTIISKSPDSP